MRLQLTTLTDDSFSRLSGRSEVSNFNYSIDEGIKKTNKCDYLHENTLCKDRQLGSNFLVAQRPSVTAGCLSWQLSVWILETPAKIMPVLARSLSIIQNLLNVAVDRIHQNRKQTFLI